MVLFAEKPEEALGPLRQGNGTLPAESVYGTGDLEGQRF
ncbi:hypothetical protein HNR06_005357 [Nocardiopsis arvandica]|uniref:Uncharacterized protein n=1 Tax=Nocardiopsis sinuspersici TaxID=501010 RepID=A0A7Y9XJU2_9ACTN|nr:hypothetical protein [Nocardiopsis sinuspersici]